MTEPLPATPPAPVRVAPLVCLLLLWCAAGVVLGGLCWDMVEAAASQPASPPVWPPVSPLRSLGVTLFRLLQVVVGMSVAALALGLTWLALPARDRGTLPWLFLLCGAVALLWVALPSSGGWWNALASAVPVVVTLEAMRAIVTAMLAALGAELPEREG